MSEAGRAIMECPCGYDRFLVAGVNTFRCQRCGTDIDIQPTMRYIGQNDADRTIDWKTYRAFRAMKGEK